jgi:hypothetical protein
MSDNEFSTGIYGSSELKIVAAGTVAGTVLLWVLLTMIAWTTDAMLLDLRQFSPISCHADRSPQQVRQFYESIQTTNSAQRPFQLTLMLERIPTAGDFFAVEHELPASDGEEYCFQVFTHSPYFNATEFARAALGVAVLVDEVPVVRMPIADRRGSVIDIDGIKPHDGSIRMRFEVRAYHSCSDESWRQASLVQFELATLERCQKGALETVVVTGP